MEILHIHSAMGERCVITGGGREEVFNIHDRLVRCRCTWRDARKQLMQD
jgi:hypothetical protein